MIDYTALLCFSEVAKHGSFGRAAAALTIRVSTISRRVSRLEDELGLTLFERGRAGLRLTVGGRVAIVHVHRALADLEAMRSSAKCSAMGKVSEIRLGVRLPPVGIRFQSLLEKWSEKFPKVALRLFEMSDRDLLTYLAERRIDVAFMPKHSVPAHLATAPICRERLFLAMPKRHRLVRRKTVKWQDLHAETFLVQGWDESQAARELYTAFLGSGVHYEIHAASKQSVIALIGAGFGLSLVTQGQAEARFPGVAFKGIAETNARIDIDLIWAPENKEAVVGRFVAFMRDEARSRHLI